jgi:hypothetical protein
MKKSDCAGLQDSGTTDEATPKYVEAGLDLAELTEAGETVQKGL